MRTERLTSAPHAGGRCHENLEESYRGRRRSMRFACSTPLSSTWPSRITNEPSLTSSCCPGFPWFVHSVELSYATFLRAFAWAGQLLLSICDKSLYILTTLPCHFVSFFAADASFFSAAAWLAPAGRAANTA